MRFVRLLLTVLAGFLVFIAALWTYDTYKASRIAKERRQVTALTESTNQLRALQSEHLRYGLQAVSMYRRAVEEVYFATRKLPESNAEIGLLPSTENRSSKVDSLGVQRDGILVVQYANFPQADGIWLRLVPEIPSGNLPMNWRCESNFKDIKMLIPPCEHRPQ